MNSDFSPIKTLLEGDKTIKPFLEPFSYNIIVLLSLILLIFITINLYFKFIRKNPSPDKVESTIKLSLFGLALFLLERKIFPEPPLSRAVVEFGNLIFLVCLANLIIFLITDVYLHFRTRREVPSFLRDLITLITYLIFGIISLRVIFHIDISSIVTTTTVLTATIAFAMQNTLTNVLSGFSIQSDNFFRKNSWISVKDKDVIGKIVNVGFRYTSLKTNDNTIVMVPNNLLMQNVVVNLANENDLETSIISLDISLGYELPPAIAKHLLLEVLKGENGILHHPSPVVQIFRFSDSSIDYHLKYVVSDFATRDQVKDRLYTRIWYTIHREGHEFPYPHREIISVSDKKPPFYLNKDDIRKDLDNISIFDKLSENEKEYVAENSRLGVFGPGEPVVKEGEPGESLFLVMKGELLVSQNGINVGNLKAGDFFGEMSLLTGALRNATVTADNEVWLVEIIKDTLEPIFQKNPDVMEILSAALAEREEINAEKIKSTAKDKESLKSKDEFLEILKSFFGF